MKKYAPQIIYFQIIYVMFSGLLIDLGLPTSIRYFLDVVNLSMLLLSLAALCSKDGKGYKVCIAKAKLPIAVMLVWYLFMVVSTCFKDFSLLRIAWASRNWARFFVIFIACMMFLHKEETERVYKWFFGIYIFNFLLICFEFIVLGHKQDNLGGIFGSMVGGNGQNNILLCIVVIMGLCGYFERKVSMWIVSLLLISAMVIAALEELKVFYYEYIGILAIVCVIYAVKKQTDRRALLRIIVTALLAWLIGAAILAAVFPKQFNVIIGKKNYWAYEAGCSSSYKISRVKFISQIDEMFFGDSLSLKLTGYGFGNCEYSKFDFLTSNFYREHGDMNYLFFSHQPLYLEGGLIGLTLFVSIFAVIALQHFSRICHSREVNRYAVLGFVFGLITMINVFYNNAARTEISYLTYFCLASAYIMTEKGCEKEDEDSKYTLHIWGYSPARRY